MAMLEVTSLGISFGGLRAVDELSMKIEKGRSGRSHRPERRRQDHRLQYADRRIPPDDGGIRLDGQNLIGKSRTRSAKMGVARTFQNIRLFSELSVLDNVKTGLHNQITYSFAESMFHLGSYRKKREKQMDEKAMELLSVFGLEASRTTARPTCPTASSASSRSRALATDPSCCCCSTSRQPA